MVTPHETDPSFSLRNTPEIERDWLDIYLPSFLPDSRRRRIHQFNIDASFLDVACHRDCERHFFSIFAKPRTPFPSQTRDFLLVSGRLLMTGLKLSSRQ